MNKKNENKVWKTTGNVLFLIIVVVVVSSYLYQSFQIDLIMSDMHSLHQKKKQLLSETESLEAEVNRLALIHFDANIYKTLQDREYAQEKAKELHQKLTGLQIPLGYVCIIAGIWAIAYSFLYGANILRI